MTKTIHFDLDFTIDGKIKPISWAGRCFLDAMGEQITTRQIYQNACEVGMHIRFVDASVRDRVSSICAQ